MKKASRSRTIFLITSISTFILCIFLLGPISLSAHGTQISVAFAQATGNAPATCSFSGGFSFLGCIWIPIVSWLGSWILSLGAGVLVFSGGIFDWLVQRVIINFAGTLTDTGTLSAITKGWTFFRDLANIGIIGMFTFIAIATILGNTEYGYKKMLSRVLIVAILINFSLLFAKIIIDFGNVTAYQIYKQTATVEQSNGTNLQTFDIAGAFLKPMGITDWWDTTKVVESFGQNTNSSLQAFAFSLVGGLLLFGLAIVILYGCFLIAARAIMLIVLMVTAAGAFVSHLIPRFSESPFGWSGWWKNLINASLFAPLLMIFLYISLLVLNGAQQASQSLSGTAGTAASGTMGSVISGLLTSPSQTVNTTGWTVIMLYVFGIGLLFASFRLSSSFASSIGGLNFGQTGWDKFANLAWNSASGVGGYAKSAGQYGWQRFAYRKSEQNTKQARDFSLRSTSAIKGSKEAQDLANKAEKKARSAVRFGEWSGGYKKKVDERAEKVTAVLKKAQPTGEQRADQVKAAVDTRKTSEEYQNALEKNLKETQQNSKSTAEALKRQIEQEAQSNTGLAAEHKRNSDGVEEENIEAVKTIADRFDQRAKELSDAIARGGIDNKQREGLQKQLLQSEESRKSELRHQGDRVERARQVALLKTASSGAASNSLKQAVEKNTQQLEANHKKEDDLDGKISHAVETKNGLPTKEDIQSAQNKTTETLINRIATKQTGLLGRAVGVDNDVAKVAREKHKTESESGRLSRILNKRLEQDAKNQGSADGAH